MEKKYLIDNLELMKEWNGEKNNILNLNIQELTCSSGRKIWWKCKKGHEWQAVVANRNKGSGCPYCAGKKVLKGENDLQTVNPTLASEWLYEKNNGLTPADVMPNSNKKVWWKCKKGHEWQAYINNRNKGIGCPCCAGQRVIKGENDLQTVNPTLANEWLYEKNNGLKPADVMANSHHKVWWKCTRGHEWRAGIDHRNSKESGCPYCANKKILREYNDLGTTNPTLAKEWDYEKNNGLTPADVMANSHHKVWWKCTKGHEWQAVIASRNAGCGCPYCVSERHTSFPEYALVYYFKKYGLEVIHSYKKQGYELDVYIPSKKIAIEYDGYFWHKNKEKKDLRKNLKCKKEGIQLYRIREGLLSLNDTSIDFLIQKNQKDLPQAIKKILVEVVGDNVEVDLERDSIEIEDLREYTEKETSILFSNPKVAREWNYTRNGKLKPENFLANSDKKVWWKCNKGHEWPATIGSRNVGYSCPYCAGQKAIKGENDLQTVNPTLASEWLYEKNNGLTPADVMPNSNKKVWWKCNKGHEWQAWIGDRNRGRGCPYCARDKRKKK